MAGSTQSAWIEALYKRDLLNKLNSLAKSMRFLRFRERIVFVQLELSDNGLENFRIEVGTVVICPMANLTCLMANKKVGLCD